MAGTAAISQTLPLRSHHLSPPSNLRSGLHSPKLVSFPRNPSSRSPTASMSIQTPQAIPKPSFLDQKESSSSSLLHFVKYHGLGNDFIMVDNRDSTEPRVTPEQAARMCDRNFGIGADGVIFVMPGVGGTDYTMRIFNSDGSEPEEVVSSHLDSFLGAADGELSVKHAELEFARCSPFSLYIGSSHHPSTIHYRTVRGIIIALLRYGVELAANAVSVIASSTSSSATPLLQPQPSNRKSCGRDLTSWSSSHGFAMTTLDLSILVLFFFFFFFETRIFSTYYFCNVAIKPFLETLQIYTNLK